MKRRRRHLLSADRSPARPADQGATYFVGSRNEHGSFLREAL
jgi:hypothetical protein